MPNAVLMFRESSVYRKPKSGHSGDAVGCARYYNDIRTNRSLEKDAPVSRPVQRTGSIKSFPILGGLLPYRLACTVIVVAPVLFVADPKFLDLFEKMIPLVTLIFAGLVERVALYLTLPWKTWPETLIARSSLPSAVSLESMAVVCHSEIGNGRFPTSVTNSKMAVVPFRRQRQSSWLALQPGTHLKENRNKDDTGSRSFFSDIKTIAVGTSREG
jgi:hypothetical protein